LVLEHQETRATTSRLLARVTAGVPQKAVARAKISNRC
jgi:hypothetical protein